MKNGLFLTSGFQSNFGQVAHFAITTFKYKPLGPKMISHLTKNHQQY